jgi:hypothetical protein
VFEGALVVGGETGFVAQEQSEGGLFGEVGEGDGEAAAFLDAFEGHADGRGEFVHLDVEEFILHGPAAPLLPNATGHAGDGVFFSAVARAEAGEVVDADSVVVVVLLVDGDEGCGAESVGDRVLGDGCFAFGCSGSGTFLGVGAIGGEALFAGFIGH